MSALPRTPAFGLLFERFAAAVCVAFGLAVGVGVGGVMAETATADDHQDAPTTPTVTTTNTSLDLGDFSFWGGIGSGSNIVTVRTLLESIMSFLGMTAVLAAVLGVMVGGFFILFSAGENGMESGKKILIASAIGLAVVMMSYLIVTLLQTFIYSV